MPLNSVLDVTLHLENVSEQPISFVTETWSERDHLLVTDSAGHEHRVGGASSITGMPTPVRWTLAPGEVADVTAAVIGVSDDKWVLAGFDSHPMCMHLPAKQDAYTIRYVTRMGNAVMFPHSTDWQGELVTGETPLVVR